MTFAILYNKNRFVTGTHAEITFESGAAYITDKTV